MDAQSMAIVMATSSSVSTPGVVHELMAEILRLRDAHAAEAQRVRDRDAERDAELQRMRDGHAAELNRMRNSLGESLMPLAAAFTRRAASNAMEAWSELED